MGSRREWQVRKAGVGDAETVGQLLHDFNTEYDDFTPGPAKLAARLGDLMQAGEATVLLGGEEGHGLAVLRFRPSLWTEKLDAYLEELYVTPNERGHGLGRALMETAIATAREMGAGDMHLGTGEDDIAARSLYESLGFINREGGPAGPISYFYEREL